MLIIVDTKDLNTVLNAYIPSLLVHIFKPCYISLLCEVLVYYLALINFTRKDSVIFHQRYTVSHRQSQSKNL